MPHWATLPRFGAANSRLVEKKALTPLQVKAFESGFSAESTLEAMDAEGVDVAVLYRTVAGILIACSDELDAGYAAAACRAYNNWLAGYCRAEPSRLKGAALIPLLDVDLAIAEAQRAALDLGFIGVCVYPEPMNGRLLYDEEMEPFWSRVEDLGLAVGVHGTSFAPAKEDISRKYLNHPAGRTVTHALAIPTQMMAAAAGLILSGVLERHPGPRVAFLEAGCAWLPWFLDRLDDQWENTPTPLCRPRPAATSGGSASSRWSRARRWCGTSSGTWRTSAS
jgi:predicted TIM-barrel fold metal-dependent hydrolase